MAKVEELGFGVGHGYANADNELQQVLGELADVDEEMREIEFLLHKLARRRERLDQRFAELVKNRDRLEQEAWQRKVDDMHAAQLVLVDGPQPPALEDRTSIKLACDPAPEPWDVEDVADPVPQWVSPARTWPIPMPGLMPARPAPRRSGPRTRS